MIDYEMLGAWIMILSLPVNLSIFHTDDPRKIWKRSAIGGFLYVLGAYISFVIG